MGRLQYDRNNDFWQQLPTQIQEIVIPNTKTYVAQQRALVRAAANLEQTLRGRGMLIKTVDIESFRERLRAANFYRNWRQSVGEEA
jgi:TRAP-type transport system periplasmic protein